MQPSPRAETSRSLFPSLRFCMVPPKVYLALPTGLSSSKARDVDRSRYASICAWRSATFCSAVAMASAPAMKRRGGCAFLAIVTSARASLAGSPPCLPLWACHHFSCSTVRSEEHTSELQSHSDLVCRLLLEKKNHKSSGPLCDQKYDPHCTS